MSETTLLVVDDDREIRLLLSGYLEGHGFQVVEDQVTDFFWGRPVTTR